MVETEVLKMRETGESGRLEGGPAWIPGSLPTPFTEVADVDFLRDEPLARHTTFGVGGPVAWLARPRTEDALVGLLSALRIQEIPHVILGGGSNVLAPDDAWDVVAVQLTQCASAILPFDSTLTGRVQVYAGAGAGPARLLQFCLRHELAGVEFLAGIPGTIGGAVVMNAGTRDGSLADVLEWVDIINVRGERERIPGSTLPAAYRNMGLPEGSIVLGALLRLRADEKGTMRRRLRDILKGRKRTQPLGWPSAGCIFKNPEGASAGALIDRAGLKGFRIGGAEVSEKHANWIINRGNAKASEILELIRHIEEVVISEFGVHLEREIRVLA